MCTNGKLFIYTLFFIMQMFSYFYFRFSPHDLRLNDLLKKARWWKLLGFDSTAACVLYLKTPVIQIQTHTLFPDSLTISALASSALSLFLQTMWIVPPQRKRWSIGYTPALKKVTTAVFPNTHLSWRWPWRLLSRFHCSLQ